MHRKTPVTNPVVVLRKEFDDWAVLFNPDTAEAVGINPVGVAVWEMLGRQQSLDDILAGIKEEFQGIPEDVKQEVETFIRDLAERGFVAFEESGNR